MGLILFAAFLLLAGGTIEIKTISMGGAHGHHHYADDSHDTQLFLAMRASTIRTESSKLEMRSHMLLVSRDVASSISR